MVEKSEEFKFVIENSQIGVKTLKVQKNNTAWYLHSKYDPILQAQRFAELNYDTASEILVYGLGLGYHVKAMLDLMNDKQKLYVLETNSDTYDIFKQVGAVEIIEDERLEIIIPKDFDEIDSLLSGMHKDFKLLYYAPSVKLVENKFISLKTLLNNYRIDMNTTVFFKKMHENHSINTQLNCKNFLQLFENRYLNIPCIIVSSGPSLKYADDFIKSAKGNCIIISIGRNSGFFKELGVEPTIFIEIDCQDLVAERFENYTFKCPLVFLSTVSNKLPLVYKGPKSIIYVRSGIADTHVVEGGGSTVAATALELAVEMGCSPIGLVAQDLVYDGGSSHFNSDAIHQNPDLMQRYLCNDGELRYTNDSFIRHKVSLENVIERAKGARVFYSLTKKGICINNASFIEPYEFLSRYSTDVSEIEKEIVSEIKI